MDRASWRGVAEVVVVVGSIGLFLWFGRQAFAGVNLVFPAALLAVLAYSHWRAGESWSDIGFRWDTSASATAWMLPIMWIACVVIWIGGFLLRHRGVPSPTEWSAGKVAEFMTFGVAQQYVMLGFIFKRVERASGKGIAPVLTALLFALLHLPNAFLTAVTFVWGIVSCLVYRRSPNLWINGVVHGLLAAQLYYVLPRSLTGGLRVGMEYVAAASS